MRKKDTHRLLYYNQVLVTRQYEVGKRDKGADVIATSLPEKSEIERRLAFLLVVLERTVVFGEFDLVL